MASEDRMKRFSNILDSILAGEDVDTSGVTDEELLRTIEFARKMRSLRESPDERFTSQLRGRLLSRVAEEDARAHHREKAGRLQGLWRKPVWQIVLAVVVTAFAVNLAIHLKTFTPETAPEPSPTPSPEIAPAPEPEAAAPDAMIEEGTLSLGNIELASHPSRDSYSIGEEVAVEFKVTNHGSETVHMSPFPPQIEIVGAESHTVWESSGGEDRLSVEAGETVSYHLNWDQSDASGAQVSPGDYHLEFLTYIEQEGVRGQAGTGTSFSIY